jgi:hypothetical protein
MRSLVNAYPIMGKEPRLNWEHQMSDLSVADLTVAEPRTLIREVVTETITSLFVAHDEGQKTVIEFVRHRREVYK